jgi:ribosomal protein L37AE/L43A
MASIRIPAGYGMGFNGVDIVTDIPPPEYIWQCKECGLRLSAPSIIQLREAFKARNGIGILLPLQAEIQDAYALCPECGNTVNPVITLHSNLLVAEGSGLDITLIGERVWTCKNCGLSFHGVSYRDVTRKYMAQWGPSGQPTCEEANCVLCPICKKPSRSQMTTQLFT